MKQILTFAIILTSLVGLDAQNAIEKYFSDLSGDEATTHITLTGKMFELVHSISAEVEIEDEELTEMQDFLGSITSFEMVVNENIANPKSQFKKGDRSLSKTFEELIRINDKDGNFMLYIDEQDGVVHEIVGLGQGAEEVMVFSLMGSLRLDQVGQLVQKIENTGFDQLSRVSDIEIDDIKLFPNPVAANNRIQLEVPASLHGTIATLYDASGRMVKTYKISGSTIEIDIDGLEAGNYHMSLDIDGVLVNKKFYIVD